MSTSNKLLHTFRHLTRATGSGTVRSLVPRVTRPILSAPMNGWSGPNLVAAVANHGGLPIYPIGYYTDPAKILQELKNTTTLIHDVDPPATPNNTDFLPYAVGFISFWLERQGPELLLAILRGEGDTSSTHKRPPAAYWFSFGDYRPYLALVREHGRPGSKVIVQVNTVQEAVEAQNNKVDVIVVQGTEAGGHGAQKVSPLMTLLPEVLHALHENKTTSMVPAVLAAGGISTALQFKAVESMGASGVVIGTGFMPTDEAPGPQWAKDRLLKTQDGGVNTVRTRIFDALREFDWPEGYDGRVVRNLVTEREAKYEQAHGSEFNEGAAAFKLLKEDHSGVKADWAKATAEQDFNLLPLWSGTGVGLLKKQMSAAAFMDLLLGEKQ
ncbi:MAG: 2-nitropropane dioxygenase [Podila humilis]|nr:MAG: 2-nitropropane dioxygenase [Podila humilis]